MTQELLDVWCRDIDQRRRAMEAHDVYAHWESTYTYTYP